MADLGPLEQELEFAYHASRHGPLSNVRPFLHVGTEQAALERLLVNMAYDADVYDPGNYNPKLYKVGFPIERLPYGSFTDNAVNEYESAINKYALRREQGYINNPKPRINDRTIGGISNPLVKSGILPYENAIEHAGSTSYVIKHPKDIKAMEEIPIKFSKFWGKAHSRLQTFLDLADKYPHMKKLLSIGAGIPDFTPLEVALDMHKQTTEQGRKSWMDMYGQ